MQREITICSECGSTKLGYDRKHAEVVCNDCGYVVVPVLYDNSAEYAAFTEVDHSEILKFGTDIPKSISPRIHRTYAEKKLNSLYFETKYLSLPEDIKSRVLHIAKAYLSANKLPVNDTRSFVEAIAYYVCRENGIIYKKKVRRKILAKVKKSLAASNVAVWENEIKYELYVDRLCTELGLDFEVRKKAKQLLNSISGFAPWTLCALAVSLASGEVGVDVPSTKIAKCAGISPSTLWKACNRVKEVSAGSMGRANHAQRRILVEGIAEKYPLLRRLVETCAYLEISLGDALDLECTNAVSFEA